MYINIWNAVDREILVGTREIDKLHDNYTVLFICNLCYRPCSSGFEHTFFKLPFAAWIYHITQLAKLRYNDLIIT